jgi:hypothetical protein
MEAQVEVDQEAKLQKTYAQMRDLNEQLIKVGDLLQQTTTREAELLAYMVTHPDTKVQVDEAVDGLEVLKSKNGRVYTDQVGSHGCSTVI